MEFLAFIGCIILFIWVANLSGKIQELESIIESLKSKAPIKKINKVKSVAEEANKAKEIFQKQKVQTKEKNVGANNHSPLQEKGFIDNLLDKNKGQNFEAFMGAQFFKILGGLSVVLAIGFFATYAFSHGWIGPIGRIAIGMMVSIVFLVMGELMREKYPNYFSILSAVGIAGMLITTFLARNYPFVEYPEGILEPMQAFWAYIIEVSAGIALSLRYKSRVLANFSIVGGLLAPVMTNADMNDLMILAYLSILSIAGFIVSLKHSWVEILIVLFLGVASFEAEMLNDDIVKNTPLIFLSFLFGLHVLFGSGGIIRMIREKASQTFDKTIEESEIFELLLFTISILVANFFAAEVFAHHGWEHFGFFVLAQGFGLYGLSEVLRAKKLAIFQKISLGATMLAIIFATVWEIGFEHVFILTLALILEGVLFIFGGRIVNETIFLVFGKIALFLGFSYHFYIEPFSENTMAMVVLVGVLLYSFGTPKNIIEKIWGIGAIALATISLFFWNFETFYDILPNRESIEYVLFILPSLWAIAITFSVLKTQSKFSLITGLILILIVNAMSWDVLGHSYKNSLIHVPSLEVIIILAANFTLLSAFFIENFKTHLLLKKIAVILILAASTFLVWLFGIEQLSEPLRSLIWIIWGALLLGFGFSNSWPHFRYFGMGVFCFLIAKLYLFDVWEWDTMQKFIAFGALGVTLLGISFNYSKLVNLKK